MKVIAYPILPGKDWLEPEPPVAVKGESKTATLRAVSEAGYTIMHVGGKCYYVYLTAYEAAALGKPADEDGVIVWSITVHPRSA
jgi:xanthine dehydrogenase molybdopterin-binding subunit B